MVEVVGDVQALHVQSHKAGTLFQVASRFNLLEMVSPQVIPESESEYTSMIKPKAPRVPLPPVPVPSTGIILSRLQDKPALYPC